MDLHRLRDGVLAGERAVLGRAITLVESTRPDHRSLAQQLLADLLPATGHAHRVGVTGVPGVGKSTLLDAFGSMLTADGHRVAVLAVDPTSTRTGGSILGDKTRMPRLAVDDAAFVRPSPTSGTLGGVARRTRETLLLCEAAGFDVVLVETVGVGQSEVTVAQMVDVFVALMLPGAGDQLQGIKKGLLEVADVIAVNKADGDRVSAADRAAGSYRDALRILGHAQGPWHPRVLTVSGKDEKGLAELWQTLGDHREALEAVGALDERRAEQRRHWLWSEVEDTLLDRLRHDAAVAELVEAVEEEVVAATLPAGAGADRLVDAFLAGARSTDRA